MSDEAASVNITALTSEPVFSCADLAQYLDAHPDVTLVKEGDFDNTIAVYGGDIKQWNRCFRLIRGVPFSAEDILTGRRVALVSEDGMTFTRTENGVTLYQHNGLDYEVIGIIQSEQYECFVPLMAELRDNPSPVAGLFYLDSGKNTQVNVSKWKSLMETINPDVRVEIGNASSGYAARVTTNLSLFASVFSLLVLIIVLCLDTVAQRWTDSRKKELFARLLSGACSDQAVRQLTRQYAATVCGALTVGASAGVVLVWFGVFGLSPHALLTRYAVAAAVIGAMFFVVGTGDVYLQIKKMVKAPICELRR